MSTLDVIHQFNVFWHRIFVLLFNSRSLESTSKLVKAASARNELKTLLISLSKIEVRRDCIQMLSAFTPQVQASSKVLRLSLITGASISCLKQSKNVSLFAVGSHGDLLQIPIVSTSLMVPIRSLQPMEGKHPRI